MTEAVAQDGETQTSHQAETLVPPVPVPFAGAHQAAVLLAPTPAGVVASCDVVTTDRGELVDVLQLMNGDPIEQSAVTTAAVVGSSSETKPPKTRWPVGHFPMTASPTPTASDHG